jgi:hypothetical protein
MKNMLKLCIIIITASFILFGCAKKGEAPSDLEIDGRIITWSEVDGAISYIIKINDTEYETTEPAYTVPNAIYGSLEVSVKAVTEKRSSEFSESSEFTLVFVLSAPADLRQDGSLVKWNAVSLSSGYTVKINGIDYNTTNTEYAINPLVSVQVQVRAVGNAAAYIQSSAYSSAITTTVATTELSQPENLSITSGVLSFDAVVNATSYDIYVDDSYYASVSTNQYTLPSALLSLENSYIQVKAKANGYLDSILSAKKYINATSITTEAQLRGIISDGQYLLGSDIVLTSAWEPLSFSGYFDGNGFSISNVNISEDMDHVGFFSHIDQAIISNLSISGTLVSTNSHHASRIGGLAGLATDSEINNVTIDMDITVISNNGIGMLGGLVGDLQNTNIISSYYLGEINSTHFITGGLIGKASNPITESMIFQSSVVATVLVEGGEQSYVGGFIGYMINNMLSISESFAEVDITGSSYVGGFVGYMGSGMIGNSYAKGSVTATNELLVHAGGFIGRLEGYNSLISNSVSMSTVTASATGDNIFKGAFVGKTVGGTLATVYVTCIYDNSITALDRIGNPTTGRGDGINGLNFQTQSITGFSTSIWNLTSNSPKLNWED